MNLLARLDHLNIGISDSPVLQPTNPINGQSVIEQVFNQLDDNIGAWCNDEFLAVLADLYQTDRQQLVRVYDRLKKWGIATEVKKEVKVFSRKRRISKHPTLPTHSTFSNHTVIKNLHRPSTHPTLTSGILVTVNEETGQPALLIESEGALVMAEAIRGYVAYAQNAKTWHIFDGNRWEPLKGSDRIDALFIELLYLGTAAVGFKKAYKNNVRDIVADGHFTSATGGSPIVTVSKWFVAC
jgi:hypothetical protein